MRINAPLGRSAPSDFLYSLTPLDRYDLMPTPSYCNIGQPHAEPPPLSSAPFVVVAYRTGGAEPTCTPFTEERIARTYAKRRRAEALTSHVEVCSRKEFAVLQASWNA